MLNNIFLLNYPSDVTVDLKKMDQAPFILSTCQRNLVVYYNQESISPTQGFSYQAQGVEAYQYLLEIICGLQSKLIAESEIVSQFKHAYKSYLEKENRNSSLIRVLEKLFKDAKCIRSEYLKGISQKTYSYIARKNLVGKYQGKEVLILGSGKMAEDLILQMNKKARIYLSSRNSQKARELKEQYKMIQIVDWDKKEEFSQFSHIANTIGYEGQLLSENFFDTWEKKHRRQFKLFLDLGSPSCIKTPMTLSEGVMRLEDVFQEGSIKQKQETEQIQLAQVNLEKIAHRRHELFQGSNRAIQ